MKVLLVNGSPHKDGCTDVGDMVHESLSIAEDIQKDEEGVQIMRILGKNMAWFLKCKELASKSGLSA